MAPRVCGTIVTLQLLLLAPGATGQTPAPSTAMPTSAPASLAPPTYAPATFGPAPPAPPPPFGPGTPAPPTSAPPTAEPGCVRSWEGPQQEGFESSFGGWFQDAYDDVDWTRRSGSTSSFATGPTSAYEGRYYAYVEASLPNNPNKRAYLNSPCFDLDNATSADFSFAYHMYGAAVGTMALEASADEGLTWTSLWNESGSQGVMWKNEVVDLSPYAGYVVRLRFNYVTGISYTSDAAIDRLRLSIDGSTVAPPTSAPHTSAPPSFGPGTSVPPTSVPPPFGLNTSAPPPFGPGTPAPPTPVPGLTTSAPPPFGLNTSAPSPFGLNTPAPPSIRPGTTYAPATFGPTM